MLSRDSGYLRPLNSRSAGRGGMSYAFMCSLFFCVMSALQYFTGYSDLAVETIILANIWAAAGYIKDKK